MAEPLQISVTSSADKLPQREQIEQLLQRAKDKAEPLRIRVPLTLYDSKNYVFLRDAAWNLQLPAEQVSVEQIEQLIGAIGTCITAIARDGSAAVVEKLSRAEAATQVEVQP